MKSKNGALNLSELELANLDVIEFECPRCLNSIRVAIDQAGQRIDCPSCQGSLLVPAASAGNDLFGDLFDSGSGQVSSPLAAQPSENPSTPNSEENPVDQGLELDSGEDVLAGIQIPKIGSGDASNPLEGKDPFEVDPDAAIRIDGVGDLFAHADVYGIKCDICDTRIHVRPDQIDSHVECPECYSKVLVTKQRETNKHTQRWLKENRDKKDHERTEEELKLSKPVELPPVDKSFGFAAPEEDLLAPKPKAVDPKMLNPEDSADEYGLEVVEEDEDNGLELMEEDQPQPVAAAPKPKSPPSSNPSNPSTPRSPRQQKSRRELYEESLRKQAAAESGTVYQPELSNDETTGLNFPSFDASSLTSAAIVMIKSRGVMWRVMIAVVLMCVGTIVMQWFFPDSAPEPEEQVDFWEWLFKSALPWAGLGVLPYLLGVAMLWLTSAYIYRDAALGHRTVKTWKNAGASELTGTLLIFGFGFFVGGLPALFLTLLTMPLRVLFSPLLLLASWYSQAPFSIVNVDAFNSVNKNMGHWIAFYKFMFLLAAVSLIAGLIFWLRVIIPVGPAFILSAIVSIVGVLIMTAVTLVFAAVCGWHCGKVVEGLQE